MREVKFKVTRANGVDLACYDWPGATPSPSIVFCHATSFHARCWDEVIRHLDPSLPVTAMDMRGHGRSARMSPPMRWRDFGEDVAALGATLGLRNAIGVGHSMGGHAVTLAAALRPELFRALVLVDPVIANPEEYGDQQWVENHYARKRRRTWDSTQQMFERFASRPPFDAWNQQVLRDYCDYALNGQELACLPEVEGSIYENCMLRDANIYPEVARIEIPVLVIRSKVEYVSGSTQMEASVTNPKLAQFFKNGRDEHWLDVSHFIPMEAPEQVARAIESMMD